MGSYLYNEMGLIGFFNDFFTPLINVSTYPDSLEVHWKKTGV